MTQFAAGVGLVLLIMLRSLAAGKASDEFIRLPSDRPSLLDRAFPHAVDRDSDGKKWAVLIAGSSGYWNYRHQVIDCFFRLLVEFSFWVFSNFSVLWDLLFGYLFNLIPNLE